MNRREFIKGCIVGTLAITVPLIAAPEKVRAFRLNLNSHDLKIGDYIQVRSQPVFTAQESGGTLSIFNKYETYMYVGNDEFVEIAS